MKYIPQHKSKIISILTAEQHYLLSNLDKIKEFNNQLGLKIEQSIFNRQDITSVAKSIEVYCTSTSQKASLLKLQSKTTQEKKYKALLQILARIKTDTGENLISNNIINTANLIPIENNGVYDSQLNSDQTSNFKQIEE
jgi:hypothetical protein